MRQLTLVGPKRLEWREIPEARVQDEGDAVVHPIAVAACDIDHPMVMAGQVAAPSHGSGGSRADDGSLPVALGHEFVGDVVEVGQAVTGVAPGDLVAVPFQIACGTCDPCKAKQPQGCREVPNPSMYGFGRAGGDWGGALSDAVRVPFADQMLVKIPEGVDPNAIASVGDNMADAYRTVAPGLEEQPGAPVLVLGGSYPSIGLYAVQLAIALGAGEVSFIDVDPERLAKAESFGAIPVEGHRDRYEPHPVVVDASGSKKGLACAMRSMAPGGICTTTSVFFEDMTPLPLAELYWHGAHLRAGMARPRPFLPAILELVADGRFQPELVTSRLVGWEEAPDALLEPEIKLVISRTG